MLFVFLQNLNMFSGFWSSIHGLLFGFTLQAALRNGGTMHCSRGMASLCLSHACCHGERFCYQCLSAIMVDWWRKGMTAK
jgi:hypothetical protein